MLQRLAEQHDPEARVWTGSEVPAAEQGIIFLGTPLGHDEFVRAQLELKSREHDLFLSRIPSLADLQSAWALLLHCASSRAHYLLRVIRPDLVRHFAERHDESIRTCVCQILGVHNDESDAVAKQSATLPLSMGGLDLRSAVRTSVPAHWASWGDCLGMINDRHPEVAHMIVTVLENHRPSPNLEAAAHAKAAVTGVHGFGPPDWRALANGLRPPPREPEEHEPGSTRQGWQHEASVPCEWDFRVRIMTTMTASERTLLRSQSGPGAGVALSAAPSNIHNRIESHLFRVLLQRRLRLFASVLPLLQMWPSL